VIHVSETLSYIPGTVKLDESPSRAGGLPSLITLKTLCESLFASQRALFYGFEEMLGTTPMAYLKVMRLQAIHRALKATAPGARSIVEIAQDHGFYSQGHFIRAYKTLFGETPGKTLKQTT
jgi:AraC family ethanolamine operon transcriptional activator